MRGPLRLLLLQQRGGSSCVGDKEKIPRSAWTPIRGEVFDDYNTSSQSEGSQRWVGVAVAWEPGEAGPWAGIGNG